MLDLFDIKEEDIDIFENNMFDESIGETEVYIDEDESYIYMDKKLVFGEGKYVLFMGSDCYYTDDGMPEPDCNVVSIFINSDNIDMKMTAYIQNCSHQLKAVYIISRILLSLTKKELTKNLFKEILRQQKV